MALATSRIYSYTTTGNKSPLVIPNGYLRFNVSLQPTSSTAKLQHTFYPRAVVEENPANAVWYDWPEGVVSENTEARLIGAATAIRVVVVSGTDVKMAVNFTNA